MSPDDQAKRTADLNTSHHGASRLVDPTTTAGEEPTAGFAQIASRDLSISKVRGVTVTVTLAGISFLNTMDSGIHIAALPKIAQDVGLSESLNLWPAAVYTLAAGCLLLVFGAIADAISAQLMWVIGSYLFVAFIFGVGLAQTGFQLILFRTLLSAFISMYLPIAVSLIANTFPKEP